MRCSKAGEAAERRLRPLLWLPLVADFLELPSARCASLRTRLLPAEIIPAATMDIVPAAHDQVEAALGLLFGRLSAHDRKNSVADVLRALRSGRIARHGLFVALIDGVPIGSVLYLMQHERTAFVWPPGVSDRGRGEEVADALLSRLISEIEQADAWIGQCLIDPVWKWEREKLVRNRFAHLTDLRFMVCPFDEVPPPRGHASSDQDPLETEIYQPGVNDTRFARLLEQTYVETRDCPELQGRRTGEQALASHRMSGEFDPSRWTLFRWHGKDAGVLLLNDHPEQNAWEVVYTGVAPNSRGNGIGRRMLAHGLTEAPRPTRRDSVGRRRAKRLCKQRLRRAGIYRDGSKIGARLLSAETNRSPVIGAAELIGPVIDTLFTFAHRRGKKVHRTQIGQSARHRPRRRGRIGVERNISNRFRLTRQTSPIGSGP